MNNLIYNFFIVNKNAIAIVATVVGAISGYCGGIIAYNKAIRKKLDESSRIVEDYYYSLLHNIKNQ